MSREPAEPEDGRIVYANINLKVPDHEKWDFKAWCAQHRMSQVDAFREAFRLLQERHTGEYGS
jgi:hypothetical protein